MAAYPAGYLGRGRSQDDELYPPPATNPYYQQPPAATYSYEMGAFPGGPSSYYAGQQHQPAAATVAQPAVAMASATALPAATAAAYPMAYPMQPMPGGGYGYGNLNVAQQQPPAQVRPPARPHVHNHAAGPRTHFPKPPAGPPQVVTQGQQYDVEAGGFGPHNAITQFTVKAEQAMRAAFIRKVYAVLSLQLLASFGFCAYLTLDGAANAYVLSHPGLAYLAMAASVVMILLLMCYRNKYPTNLGLLAMWTLTEAYTIGIVTAAYARAGEGEIVLQALAITFALFFALTIFTFQTRWDFSFLGSVLFAGLWILLIWGVINAIFGFRDSFVYSLIGAIIFSGYIIFDSHMLAEKLPYDEWVLASISLYLDIIQLFVFVLQLLSESQRREERR